MSGLYCIWKYVRKGKGESASGNSAAAEQFPKTLCKATADGGYTDKQLCNCDETALLLKTASKQILRS
jgi:hypothetical protein